MTPNPPRPAHLLLLAGTTARVQGQRCLYNLGSRLWREHLEARLEELRFVGEWS